MKRLKERLYMLLRFSERYTKTDMVYVASGGFWLTVGYGVQLVLGLVLAIAFANLLPKQAYGTYQFVIACSAIIAAFSLTGMGTAVAREAARGIEGALRYGLRKQLLWSSAMVALSLVTSGYYLFNENTLLALAFLLVAFCQPLISGFSLTRPFLHGKGYFQESVVIETLQRVLPFIALSCTLLFTQEVLTLISVYFISQALAVFLGYRYVVWRYRLPVTPEPTMYAYSKHLSVMESLTEITTAIDKVLVWLFLGAAPLAAYALAQLPVLHLQSIFGFARPLAFAKLTQASFDDLHDRLTDIMRKFFLVALLTVVAYILLAPYLFLILFPNYPEAVPYSQALALLVLFIPRSLISQAFAAHQMKRELYIIHISTPAVRILLLLLGVWFYGLAGVIGALILAEVYTTILQWHLFKKSRLTNGATSEYGGRDGM